MLKDLDWSLLYETRIPSWTLVSGSFPIDISYSGAETCPPSNYVHMLASILLGHVDSSGYDQQ